MQIDFVASAGSAAILVLPVAKDGLASVAWGSVDPAGRALAAAAAQAARFDGEAGSIAELFVPGEPPRHLVLLGIGAGDEEAWSKAGGALVGRFLTSGASEVTLDLSALADAPGAKAVARFAATADQRAA